LQPVRDCGGSLAQSANEANESRQLANQARRQAREQPVRDYGGSLAQSANEANESHWVRRPSGRLSEKTARGVSLAPPSSPQRSAHGQAGRTTAASAVRAPQEKHSRQPRGHRDSSPDWGRPGDRPGS